MKSNKQYLMVGTFVLLGFAILIGIWLWFSASNRKAYDTYRVVFHEPVDGVTTNSVVKYNGVEVGKVMSIALDNSDPSSIFVDLNVLQGTPIPTSTYATIKAQGVTGMSFINLGFDKGTAFSIIKPHNQPPLLYSLSEQAQSVTGNIKDISSQVKTLLNDRNLEHVSNIVANLDRLSSALANQSGEISHAVKLVGQVLTNVNENTHSLNDAILQLNSLSKSLQKNSNSLDQVLDSVQNNTLRNINTVFLPNLNQTVTNMSRTSAQVDELMRTINQNPSVLVRGKAPVTPGPGE